MHVRQLDCKCVFLPFAIQGRAAEYNRVPIAGWLWWAYNENSGDTGGIVMNDWQDLNWAKLRFMMTRLGLTPWYRDPELRRGGGGSGADDRPRQREEQRRRAPAGREGDGEGHSRRTRSRGGRSEHNRDRNRDRDRSPSIRRGEAAERVRGPWHISRWGASLAAAASWLWRQ
jgi:hypothetical protein